MNEVSMDKIISLCKRRGFVFQASEIYGGLAGFYDYGPLGVELSNNIKQKWWENVVSKQNNIFGVDGAIIQSPKLWEASGHVGGFTDPLVDCKNCNARHRADHLAGTDSTDLSELKSLLEDTACPKCGKKELTEPRTYNLMMKTWIGPVEDESSVAYLRPETAGSIFTNFKNILDTMRPRLPFGIAQIGKAFRNEISPRDFIFRVRELEQMEMQYFIKPDTQEAAYEEWRKFAWEFLTDTLGISEKNLSWHEHEEDERAHYCAEAHDVYFKYPQGEKELWGTHNRTDYDLQRHIQHSGQDLSYLDPETNEKSVPFVVESSVGVGRLFLAVLTDAYTEDELGGEARTYLAFKKSIAPVKAAVFPLVKNKPELVGKAQEVFKKVQSVIPQVMFDDNGNIGKRYRRQDEIGTPHCVTIDYDTLEGKGVTVRDRDSGEQERVGEDELVQYLTNS